VEYQLVIAGHGCYMACSLIHSLYERCFCPLVYPRMQWHPQKEILD